MYTCFILALSLSVFIFILIIRFFVSFFFIYTLNESLLRNKIISVLQLKIKKLHKNNNICCLNTVCVCERVERERGRVG